MFHYKSFWLWFGSHQTITKTRAPVDPADPTDLPKVIAATAAQTLPSTRAGVRMTVVNKLPQMMQILPNMA